MVDQLCKGVFPCQPYAVVTDVQGRYVLSQVGIEVVELFALLGEALHLKALAGLSVAGVRATEGAMQIHTIF